MGKPEKIKNAPDRETILAIALAKVSLGDKDGAIQFAEKNLVDSPEDRETVKKIIFEVIQRSGKESAAANPDKPKEEEKAPAPLTDEFSKKIDEIIALQQQVVEAIKKIFGADADTKDLSSGVVQADKDKVDAFSVVASTVAEMFQKFAEIGLKCESEKKENVHSFAIYFPKGYEGERDFFAMNEDHFRDLAKRCLEEKAAGNAIPAEENVVVGVIGSASREELETAHASKKKEFTKRLSGAERSGAESEGSFVERLAERKNEGAAKGGGAER